MPILADNNDIARLEEMRAAIMAQIAERDARFPMQGPVFPWNLVTKAHNYVFDLPAHALRQIRLHADAMNGTLGAGYYLGLGFPQIDGESAVTANGYKFLGEGVPIDAWAREYDIPGMEELRFGFNYQGLTLCDLTVPRQQNVCNLYRLLKALPSATDRFVFVEIGAGYGSFALDALRVLGNCAYVVVDLPETLVYSAAYLITHQPKLRIYV